MSAKRSDFVILGIALAAGFTLGYFYGSGEGRRHFADDDKNIVFPTTMTGLAQICAVF